MSPFLGAVSALKDIEAESQKGTPSLAINISTNIERVTLRAVRDTRPCRERFHSIMGVWTSYFFVLAANCGGAAYCFNKELDTHIVTPAYPQQEVIPSRSG